MEIVKYVFLLFLCDYYSIFLDSKYSILIIIIYSTGIHKIPKFVYKFLKLPNLKLSWKVKGKRLNRGSGYGLEIPVIYTFNRHEKIIEWIKSKIQEYIKLEQSMKCCCLKYVCNLKIGQNLHSGSEDVSAKRRVR